MNNSYVPRNIVTVFSDEITQQMIQVSESIHQQVPSHIVLNRNNMMPHMTIYTTNFPEENEQQALARLQELAKTFRPFPIVFREKVVEMKTIFLNAEMNDALMDFHSAIVDGLNDLREGFYDQADFELLADHKERQESMVRYGMWAAKDLYIPHITLARPIDPNRCDEALQLVPDLEIQTEISSVSFVVRGPHGTCQSIIRTFPLGVE